MARLVSVILVCSTMLGGGLSGRAPQAGIESLEWLAGTWTSLPDGATEERWTRPGGDAMLGTSRTISGSRMIAFEFLRIVERDGGLVYVAQPGGRPPTEFVLARIGDRHAVFENPAHDFPKIIDYTLGDDGALRVAISDTGGRQARVFRFRRQPDRDAPAYSNDRE